MDLVDMANDLPTAAELAVKRLSAQLAALTARGDQWTEGARKISCRLEIERAIVRQEREQQS
jgi:hypothetical protein